MIKEWIAALRSGKYTQGRGFLCRDGRHCVIGVACDLLKDRMSVQIIDGVTYYDSFSRTAPATVIKALGTEHLDNIMSLNDAGSTFEEIANLVEQRIQAAMDSCSS